VIHVLELVVRTNLQPLTLIQQPLLSTEAMPCWRLPTEFARGNVDPSEAGRKGDEHRAGRDSSMERNPSNNNLDNSLANRGLGGPSLSNNSGGICHNPLPKLIPHKFLDFLTIPPQQAPASHTEK